MPLALRFLSMNSLPLANLVSIPKIAPGVASGQLGSAAGAAMQDSPPTTTDPGFGVTRSIPMNAFQRMLRGWEEVHPYNAAQVLELRRAVDPAAATAAWNATMDEMQLGRVEARTISYRHFTLNGTMSRYGVRELPTGTALDAFLSAEMNRAFNDPAEPPFRPFILPDPAAGTTHFGVVYQHWVADSVAIRHMLRRWLERMYVPRAQWKPLRIRHANIGYLGLLELAPGPMQPVLTMLSMIRRHMRYRKARKCKTLGVDDYAVAVTMQDVPGMIDRLARAAKSAGVKVNDLFLAAITRACDPRIPTQFRKQRTDLAVGSIIDLRPLARGALDDRFGLFLGFAEVITTPAEIASPPKLLKSIARQNELHRQRGIW
jgi:hypothetical protein